MLPWYDAMGQHYKPPTGSFGQIYCLNGLKIKDDSANYMRLYVRAVVYINFDQKPACLK